MENKIKNYLVTSLSSLIFIIFIIFIQLRGTPNNCSYLDPVIIDILAFAAAIFLIVEGLYNIYKNQDRPLSKNITRIIRVVFGFCIVTLHIIHFIHK